MTAAADRPRGCVRHRAPSGLGLPVCGAAAIAAFLLAVGYGAAAIPPGEILGILAARLGLIADTDATRAQETVLLAIRLPRRARGGGRDRQPYRRTARGADPCARARCLDALGRGIAPPCNVGLALLCGLFAAPGGLKLKFRRSLTLARLTQLQVICNCTKLPGVADSRGSRR